MTSKPTLIEIRKAAGLSREKVGAFTNTSAPTVRMAEIAGLDVIQNVQKREELRAFYDRLRAKAAPSPAPSAALPHPNKTRSARLPTKSTAPNDTGADQL